MTSYTNQHHIGGLAMRLLITVVIIVFSSLSRHSYADEAHKYQFIAPGWDTPLFDMPTPDQPKQSYPQVSPQPVAMPAPYCCCSAYCEKASDGKHTVCTNYMTLKMCSDMSGHCIDDRDCFPFREKSEAFRNSPR